MKKFDYNFAQRQCKTKAFTMMEMMCVVTIISIIALFVIPNYQKVLEQQREATARLNIDTVYHAQKFYWANTGKYIAAVDLTEINSKLGLSLVSTEFNYICVSDPPSTDWFKCTAVRMEANNYRVLVASPAGCNPSCCEEGGPVCPSLAICAGGPGCVH